MPGDTKQGAKMQSHFDAENIMLSDSDFYPLENESAVAYRARMDVRSELMTMLIMHDIRYREIEEVWEGVIE